MDEGAKGDTLATGPQGLHPECALVCGLAASRGEADAREERLLTQLTATERERDRQYDENLEQIRERMALTTEIDALREAVREADMMLSYLGADQSTVPYDEWLARSVVKAAMENRRA